MSRVYWKQPAGSENNAEPSRTTEIVATASSGEPFLLKDGSGSVRIAPQQVAPTGLVHSYDASYALSELRELFGRAVPEPVLNAAAETRDDHRTVAYRIEEEILPAGVTLFVQGQATDKSGEVLIGRPKGTRMIVSTQGRSEIIRERQDRERWARLFKLGLAVATAVLLLIGLISLLL